MGGPVDESGSMRIRCRCKKDDKEGWVTVKGNAGTDFAEAVSRCYTVKQKANLTSQLQSESSVVRELDVDESLEGLEEPKDEKSLPTSRYFCRALSDGKEGWVSMSTGKSTNLK